MMDSTWVRGKDGRIARKSPKRGKRSSGKNRCQICEKIVFVHRNHTSLVYCSSEDLGSYSQVMIQSDCVDHKDLITRSLRLDIRERKIESFHLQHMNYVGPSLRLSGSSYSDCILFNSDIRVGHDPRPDRSHGFHRLNSSWIQRGLVRKWKEHCDGYHTGSCTSRFESISTVSPAWLVDTWMACLVPCAGDKSYVALSYVWGGVQQYKTCSSDVDMLQRPGSLLQVDDGVVSIPVTIRDAMGWVQALSERFLWVDSLCIIQDAPQHKHSELDKMSGIYANASVTIVAAQGDASHGLRGLKDVSEPRSLEQRVYSLGKVQLTEPSFPPYQHNSGVWKTRGWTFQESLFSRRRLVFEADCVRWECGKARILEEDTRKCTLWTTLDRRQEKDGVENLQHLLTLTYPDVPGLTTLVASYNHRKLTYPEDILRAFSGMAYALSPAFPGGFVSGLPAGFLSIALLWRGSQPLSRRKAAAAEAQLRLPSWSWAGWEGDILAGSWAAAAGCIKHAPQKNWSSRGLGGGMDEAIPLCQWSYKQRSTDAGVPIHDSWQECRSKYMEGTDNCPPGWTKHRCSEPNDEGFDGRNPATRNRKWFYKHESEPDCHFWFPLPLGPKVVASPMTDAPFISCRTRRAFLHISETIPNYYPTLPLLALRSANGDWMGILQANEGTADNPIDPYRGHTIQLVEIALGKRWYTHERLINYPGRKVSRVDDIAEEFRPKPGDSYDFYHVMWVEMLDGIAYRKGMAEVYRPAWEALERETIDLTLG